MSESRDAAREALLMEALRPFAEFAERFHAKPLRGLADELYTIHTGTEWEAALRLSDCERALAALRSPETQACRHCGRGA